MLDLCATICAEVGIFCQRFSAIATKSTGVLGIDLIWRWGIAYEQRLAFFVINIYQCK
jgi:hypothetical protein